VFVGQASFRASAPFFRMPAAGGACGRGRGHDQAGGRRFRVVADTGHRRLWPGNESRGRCGAEEAGRRPAIAVLSHRPGQGGCGFATERWAEVLPDQDAWTADYTARFRCLRGLGVSLNVTGLLLPPADPAALRRLGRRRGPGSDDTRPGPFPPGLRREIVFSRPNQAWPLARRFLRAPSAPYLSRAWRTEILAGTPTGPGWPRSSTGLSFAGPWRKLVLAFRLDRSPNRVYMAFPPPGA
jgi:hypothetical protein